MRGPANFIKGNASGGVTLEVATNPKIKEKDLKRLQSTKKYDAFREKQIKEGVIPEDNTPPAETPKPDFPQG